MVMSVSSGLLGGASILATKLKPLPWTALAQTMNRAGFSGDSVI